MNEHLLKERLQEALNLGEYTMEDIAEGCRTGEFQWWQMGDGYCVTKIVVEDGLKVLSTPAVFGRWEDAKQLIPTLIDFAKEHGCTAIVGEGRKGWFRVLPKLGWEVRGRFIFLDLTK